MDNKLKRSIGFGSAFSIVIGTIIGSGIFFKQASVLDSAGSTTMALLAWIFGGLITLAAGLTIAEIGAQMPYTGGLYVYIENLYGRILGFMAGWMQIIVYGPAIIADVAGFMSLVMNIFYGFICFLSSFYALLLVECISSCMLLYVFLRLLVLLAS